MISVMSMLLVAISCVRRMSLFLIDCAFTVALLHCMFGLGMVTSEICMFSRLPLFMPFCLSCWSLLCLVLIGFRFILSILIVAMALYGTSLGLGLSPVDCLVLSRAFSS